MAVLLKVPGLRGVSNARNQLNLLSHVPFDLTEAGDGFGLLFRVVEKDGRKEMVLAEVGHQQVVYALFRIIAAHDPIEVTP